MEDISKLKEEGNTFFKEGQYEDALERYTRAINLNPGGGAEMGVFYKNRAAVYLKTKKYEEAIRDTSKALELAPNDPKALFRRCQAREALEKYEEAYKDAATLIQVDPKNQAIQPILGRLNPIIHERLKQQSSTDSKVSQMFELAFNSKSEDNEKKIQAAKNLIVLAREEAGAEKIYQNNGIPQLINLLEKSKDVTLQVTALRVMACLANNSRTRSQSLLDQVSLKRILVYVSTDSEDLSTASAHLLQNIITWISDVENIRKAKDKYETRRLAESGCKDRPWVWVADKIEPEVIPTIDGIFKAMIGLLPSRRVSAYGRDNMIELVIKLVTRRDGVGWQRKFIDEGGIQALLEVAGTIPEHESLKVSNNSRMHASLAMAKIYDDLYGDNDRAAFVTTAQAYFDDMLGDNIMESKVEAVMALAALLQGPFDVGNAILGRAGILEMILAMADSSNATHIKYAVEALVHSASKKERCSGVIKQATPILKQLYQSQNDYIKVRALVGLCKLGSFGGSDASAKSFADGSTLTLSKACRKFLKNPTKDVDLRKWAAEGLAYLSLDADVKMEVVEDTEALKSLLDIAKESDKGVLYPCSQILVNLTNSYDKPDLDPQLVELAKFAKQHVPEEHEKDSESYRADRVSRLVSAGVVNALVALSKTESEACKESIARVFESICRDEVFRGLVVQQGGAKCLIPLARVGTKDGRAKAAQALAKIAITSDPNTAFPGERACEVVRPLLLLLDVEKTALENYEALMGLTNLASMNDTVRKRIVKEKGIPLVENYMFEEHEQLRQAGVECMCNLVMCEEVVEMHKEENDKIKFLVLLCNEDEDERVLRGAAGALAMMTYDKVICHKIVSSTTQWFDNLSKLAVHPAVDIQHRAVHILKNMIMADKEIATRIVESTMMEILMALTLVEEPERQATTNCAKKALEAAVEWSLIEPSDNQS